MSIEIKEFGYLPSGEKVEKLTLENTFGFKLGLITYGARIVNCVFNGVDVVLGFDDITGYINTKGYLGATVGRYANRIEDGVFYLNGKKYIVGKNETGRGHLHGGIKGFDKKIWDYAVFDDEECPAVTFSLTSPDKEMGYPGNLTVKVCFSICENSYTVGYYAQTDKDTVLNLTNHAYFNLNGYDGEDVLSTELKVESDCITPVDEKLIPTGEYMPVTGTAFDFKQFKAIGKDINDSHPQMVIGGGYDHNFVLGDTMEERLAVIAHSPITGITMTCFTDQPGVQIYTGNGLNERMGKDGKPMGHHQGFCLETQHFPASPNRENFPSAVLREGESFKSSTTYAFSRD